MTPERRARIRNAVDGTRMGWRGIVCEVCYPLGMLDEQGNPSLTRMMAVGFFVTGAHGRLWDEHTITTNDVIVLVLAAFSTLGLKGLQMFKEWRQARLVSVEQDITARIDKRIDIRREPSPLDDERG